MLYLTTTCLYITHCTFTHSTHTSNSAHTQHPTENQRDSASEPDEEDTGEPWLKLFDSNRRQYYWQNFATNAITYDEPEDELAHDKDMIGKRVKIYWVVQVNMRVLCMC